MQLDFPKVNEAIHYTLTFYEIDRIKEYMFKFAENTPLKVSDPNSKTSSREWHEIVIVIQNRMDDEIMQHMLISNSTALAYMFDTLERWTKDYRFESVWIPDIIYEIEQYNSKVYDEFLSKQEEAEEKFKSTENYSKYKHLDKIPVIHKFSRGFYRGLGMNLASDLEYTTEEEYCRFLTAYCPPLIDTEYLQEYLQIVKGLIDNFKWIVNKHLKQYQSLKNSLPSTQIQVLLPPPDQPQIVQPNEIAETVQVSPKIKVNVTAGQLVALFRLLYEIEPSIFNVKDQAELRTFINNNFITSRTKGESMSEKKTANHFSDTNPKDMKHWVDILKKMRESAQNF